MGQASFTGQGVPLDEEDRIRMMQMPSSMQMPSMNLQAPEFGIVDPTYLAQLEILNQGGMNQPMGMPMDQPMGLLGSGLGPQERGPVAPFLTIPNYRPMAQSFRREAAAAGGGMSGGGGGGGGGGDNFGGGGSDIFNTTPAAGIEFTGGYNDFNDPDPMNNHRNIMGDIFGYQDPAPVFNMSTGTTDYANIGDPNAGMGGAYQGSAGSTAATADMPDGPDGANANSGGCVIATHAVASGAFTPREKRQAEVWCIKKLHNKWWGEAIRRGYRYYGKEAIANGKASTHYQEFKDFVDFGSGKRRNAKTAFTFAWRSVQFFFTGLLVKS